MKRYVDFRGVALALTMLICIMANSMWPLAVWAVVSAAEMIER